MLVSRINPWNGKEILKIFYGFKNVLLWKYFLNFMLDLSQVTPFPSTIAKLFGRPFKILAAIFIFDIKQKDLNIMKNEILDVKRIDQIPLLHFYQIFPFKIDAKIPRSSCKIHTYVCACVCAYVCSNTINIAYNTNRKIFNVKQEKSRYSFRVFKTGAKEPLLPYYTMLLLEQ